MEPSEDDPDQEPVVAAAVSDDEDPVVPRWWHSQPLGLWWLLPVGLALSTWILWQGELRRFGYAVAASLVVAAVARSVLPRDVVGGLMVRSRTWDAVILLGLAAAVAGISWSLDLS